MKPKLRNYLPSDLGLVGDFLVAHYQPGNRDGNWLRPTWDYMHSHPGLDESFLDRIGIWEESDRIVGVVHYEMELGEAFFEVHPDFTFLKEDMLVYAERHLSVEKDAGRRYLRVYINDFDHEFEKYAESRGFVCSKKHARPISELAIPEVIPSESIPNGFTLKSLADDNDLWKIHGVLWRGFNHEGDPPEEGIAWRKKMQSSSNFRKDLTIIIEAPSGIFACFCGMWYEGKNRIAYVEPLATDPDFRRMGLAKAAVWEGIRRCKNLGAETIYVGSDQEFYKSMGFIKRFEAQCWEKRITTDLFME